MFILFFSYAHLPEKKRICVLMDGYLCFSPMYLFSCPKKIPSEFSLENAQWKLRSVGEKPLKKHVFLK
jgi:hypothetical protein